MEIFLRIRESLKAPGDSELAAVKEFIRPRVLVIDAFEVRSETPFENRELDHIIDKRYDDSNATIIISNHTIKEFTNQVGPSIADRMRENGGIVTLTNSSFRNRQGV
jgi:DNA replication protein DnaC